MVERFKDKVWLATPTMHSEELEFIQEAFDRNWIAPLGFNVDGFENEMIAYLTKGEYEYSALALDSGTSALHMAVKLAGVKRIRIHGLRHSHISLLINLGFSALAIGERVGHEAVDITYHYAHLFPTVQTDMAAQLDTEREALINVRKE